MIRILNVKQPAPERYFQSDFLERFTYMKLSTVWAIWAPICILSLCASFYVGGRSLVGVSLNFFLAAIFILIALTMGFVRWTLLEYFLHRFPFHYSGPDKVRSKIAFYAHGIHHKQAMLSTRLVAPPFVSILVGLIIALIDWFILGVVFQAGWLGLALFSGTAMGYLFYDTMHWCSHFIDTDWSWYRKLRSNHMRHHRFPQGRFGVSNTFWDHIFQTYPKSKEAEEALAKEMEEDESFGKAME